MLGTLVIASRTMARAEVLERAVVNAERVADSLSVHGAGEEGSAGFAGGRVVWSSGPASQVVALSAAGDTLVRARLRGRAGGWTW